MDKDKKKNKNKSTKREKIQSKSSVEKSKKGKKGGRALLRFFLFFALGMILFYLFYYSSLYENFVMDRLLNTQARISNFFLKLIGQGTKVDGDVIFNDDFRVSIKGGCDGVEATMLYVCAILAFPLIAFKDKWRGLVWGVSVLSVINIFRIMILFLSGRYWPEMFDFLHLHGGVVIFTIISIALWMMWVNRIMNKRKASVE